MRKQAVLWAILFLAAAASWAGGAGRPVELRRVNDRVWVHVSYEIYEGTPVASNGMIIATGAGLVLVDTPWNNADTTELLGMLRRQFGLDCVLAIITHAHQDRIGGIEALAAAGIKTVSTQPTADLAAAAGYRRPQAELQDTTSLTVGETLIETHYPGAGHTKDNIVVWLPRDKVLFAGCLVKSLAARQIGNTADADMAAWPGTIQNLLARYGEAEVVIPGHGEWGGRETIEHTLRLLGVCVIAAAQARYPTR